MIDVEKVTCDRNAWVFRLKPRRAKAAVRGIPGWVNDGGDVEVAGGDGASGAETDREDHRVMSWCSQPMKIACGRSPAEEAAEDRRMFEKRH